MSQLKKGALLSYVSILLTNIIGLFLTPFIVRSLGDSEYGLYTLIGSVIAYLALMDFGLNNTIVRFVAKYRAEKDLDGEKKFLGSIFIIYFVISILIVCLGILLYFNFESIFHKSLTSEEIRKAKIMFQFLIFDLAIALPGGAFTAICTAYEYFVFPKLISIAKYFFRTIAVFAVLTLGGKAVSLVMIDTLLNVLTIILIAYFVFKKLKIKIDFKGINKKLTIHIFGYSVWIFIYVIMQTFQWNFGQMILGINTNTTTVAIFAVGIMLGSYYGAFPSAISSVLLPRATQIIVLNNTPRLITETMIRVGRINIMLQYLILSGFFLFGNLFIKLWIGPVYQKSWLVAFLVMIALTVPLAQSFGSSILEAKNKVKIKALFTLITMLFGVVFAFYFSRKFGSLGVIFSITIAILINTIFLNIYFNRVFGFEILSFFKKVFLKQTLFVLIYSIIFYSLTRFFENENWFKLIVFGFIYVLFYFIFYYIFLLDTFEKNLFKNLIKVKK